MNSTVKMLLSKIAIILVIALACAFFTACKVESVAEHDKRVAKEAEELEKQVKDATKNNTATSDSIEDTTAAESESAENMQAENAENQSAADSGSYNNGGSSDDTGAAVDNGGSSQPSNTPVAAVVTINVKTKEDGYLVNGATVVVKDGATVFDVMLQAQNNGILTISYKSNWNYGEYITGINGKYCIDGTEAGWKYRMTGKDNPKSVSSEVVHDGYVLTWFYVYDANDSY